MKMPYVMSINSDAAHCWLELDIDERGLFIFVHPDLVLIYLITFTLLFVS